MIDLCYLFVRPVPDSIQCSELEHLFSSFGRITRRLIVKNFAFVKFDNAQSASIAIKEIHGKIIRGFGSKPLVVEYARPVHTGSVSTAIHPDIITSSPGTSSKEHDGRHEISSNSIYRDANMEALNRAINEKIDVLTSALVQKESADEVAKVQAIAEKERVGLKQIIIRMEDRAKNTKRKNNESKQECEMKLVNLKNQHQEEIRKVKNEFESLSAKFKVMQKERDSSVENANRTINEHNEVIQHILACLPIGKKRKIDMAQQEQANIW